MWPALKHGCPDTPNHINWALRIGSFYLKSSCLNTHLIVMLTTRCFLPHCPCESTSPQDSVIIDVEPYVANNARDAEVQTPVYRCCWDTQHSPCGMFIQGAHRDILSHLRERHGIMHTADADLECRWSSCSMDKRLKMSSIARHIERHLGIKFRCSRCDLTARDDVVRDHIRKNPGCANAAAQLVPGPEARRIVSA